MKTCACCGYKTLDINKLFGTCEICHWEDDPIQSIDPDCDFGTNEDITLREAQKNFLEFGAIRKDFIESVRSPSESDVKDEYFSFLIDL